MKNVPMRRAFERAVAQALDAVKEEPGNMVPQSLRLTANVFLDSNLCEQVGAQVTYKVRHYTVSRVDYIEPA